MGLLDDIKNQVKKSGTNKGKFVYFKPGAKVRLRFLQDMEDGIKVPFHDSFSLGINVPCQELFGRECPHCDNDELRHRDQYMWSVWDYDANDVKIIMGPVNNASPIPSIAGMYDAYGTLIDRDYVITKNGSGTTSSFSVIPMDKVKFRNTKAKPFSKTKMLELLDKAFPDDSEDDEAPKKKPKPSKSKQQDDDDEELDYSEMSAKELYNLCVQRDIDVKPRKDADYYIEKLEEYDSEIDDDEDDWEDDVDDDDDEVDYDEMSPKELYDLCVKRDIDVEPKKSKAYYIKKLNEAESEEESDDDEW